MRFNVQPLRAVLRRFGSDGRPLARRFAPSAPVRFAITSESEILQCIADRKRLLSRHGSTRLLRFYEEHLWEAISRLKRMPKIDTARLTLALHAVDITARFGPARDVIPWARRAMEALPHASLDESREGHLAAKKYLRRQLATCLRNAAGRLSDEEDDETSAVAWELVERLGEIRPADRADRVRDLVASGSSDDASLLTYLRYVQEQTKVSAKDPLVAHLRKRLSAAAEIGEGAPASLMEKRLWINRAMLLRGTDPGTAARNLGVGYLGLEQPAKALPFLQSAIRHDDTGGVCSFLMGQALFRLGRLEDASEAFDRAATVGFSETRVAAWQALSWARSGRYERAIETFRKAESALGTEHLTSEFFVYWGRASYVSGAVEDAESQFRRALQLPGNDWRAANGLAISVRKLGREDESLEYLRRYTQTWSGDAMPGPLAYLMGRMEEKAGKSQAAAASYRQALQTSPEDPQYVLALALVLDDLNDPGAVAMLERAAAAGKAEEEVLRRLVARHTGSGNRPEQRRWLDRLWQLTPDAIADYQDRNLISQAVEAVNRRDFRKGVEFLEMVKGPQAQCAPVRELLSLALSCDACRTLREGKAGSATWDEIDRALVLAPVTEARFLASAACIAKGRFDEARARLEALVSESAERREFALFLALTEHFSGVEGAAAKLSSLGSELGLEELSGLVTFIQAHIAAANGDYKAAAGSFELWASDPANSSRLNFRRARINSFAAYCLRLGLARASQAPRLLNKLSEARNDGYWSLASVLVRHHELASGEPGEASPQRVGECEAAYLNLMEDATIEDAGAIADHYAEWLRFTLLFHLGRKEFFALAEVFEKMDNLSVEQPEPVRRLRERLQRLLIEPTHGAAYANVYRDPERARSIWEGILQQNPEDLDALHHLACFHWSAAYDEVLAGQFESSLPHWRSGLDYYCQLYARDEYWEARRAKGQSLAQPGKPFDEKEFAAWRSDAPCQRARTILDLIFHILADGQNQLAPMAGRMFEVIRASRLDPAARQRLADELAARRLDPDPLNLADFNSSRRRAQQVIDIDKDNIKARRFLLRSTAHRVHTLFSGGDRNHTVHISLLEEMRRHASWVEEQLPALDVIRDETVQDLVAYYDQLGFMRHMEGQDHVKSVNRGMELTQKASDSRSHRSALQTLETALQKLKGSYEKSDADYKCSMRLQAVNFTATDNMEHHQQQYGEINSLLTKIRNA